jgi:hypothetical protein
MPADFSVISKIAISKLSGMKPKGWDTDARKLFESVSRESFPDVDSETLEAAWREGMAHMRENYKDEWDAYTRHAKRPHEANAVPWDRVTLVKGQADGDTFELYFDVDGKPCVIECTDAQLLDPAFIQRKLVMYTQKDVNCPYLGKKQVEAWRRNIVIPWLTSSAFTNIARETISDAVEALIREYCSDTVTAETGPEVWLQLKRPIVERQSVYVPFSGLQDFIAKRSGNDPSKKAVKNTLSRMGFVVVKKGKSRLRFHSLPLTDLYEENVDPGEAGSGEVDSDRTGSEPETPKRRDSVLDELRAQERDRSETESGERSSTSETSGTTPDVPDDPFPALS